jgi:hypothetical protein
MNFPKGPPALVSSRNRFSFLFLVFALVCLHGGVALDASAAGNAIKVMKGGRVSADIVDLPLTQVLADLSQKLPIDIKGSLDRDKRLTLHFSQVTLQEALRQIMAGYNYVVIEPGPAGGRLMMTILGKAEKTVTEAVVPLPSAAGLPLATGRSAAPAPAPPAPVATTEPQPPAIQPVSLPPPNEGQPPVVAANPAPNVDTAAAAPAPATTATPPGVEPAPADQPPFNPAAWGGRGYRK